MKPTEVDQNENTLSDQVTTDIGITEKMVKTSGIPLQDAIEKVSGFIYLFFSVKIFVVFIARRLSPSERSFFNFKIFE